VQADAFNGYDGIYLESDGRIIEVACWAHYLECGFIRSLIADSPHGQCNSYQNRAAESG
jgi:hypothetical protein